MENQNPPFPPNPPQGNPYQQNPYQQNQPMGGNPMGMQQDVPNATLVLVMGICAIVICGLGPILGTIGLVMSGAGKRLYQANPSMYKESSFKNLNAGRICSIIGLCLGVLVWIYYIVVLVFLGAAIQGATHYSNY
ncbi:MAG: CCC motif membrane protein [Bacteroidetes bacterium]|nr:CCC motif membrane protein [Bacteroidota bacterium]